MSEGFNQKNFREKLPTIDGYEREKIETCLGEVEAMAKEQQIEFRNSLNGNERKVEEQEEEKKDALLKMSRIVEEMESYMKDGKYDGENRSKLWRDLVALQGKLNQFKDAVIPNEVMDLDNRIIYLQNMEDSIKAQTPEAQEEVKNMFIAELYKIKKDIYYSIDLSLKRENIKKPDWIK